MSKPAADAQDVRPRSLQRIHEHWRRHGPGSSRIHRSDNSRETDANGRSLNLPRCTILAFRLMLGRTGAFESIAVVEGIIV